MLKILVISDSHENYDTIKEIISQESDCDLIIHSGDFSNINGWDSSSQQHALSSFIHTIELLKVLNKPIICVPGNHDTSQLFHHLSPSMYSEPNLYILGSGPITVQNLRFLGLGGAPPVLMPDKSVRAVGFPFRDNDECDLAVETWLSPYLNGEKTILITHFPPFDLGKIMIGELEAETGSKALEEMIRKHAKELVLTINGHLHLQRWNQDYYGTSALNPGCVALRLYAVVLLEVGEEVRVREVRMKNI